ncbi:MAG: glucose-6-phosphate dehydrogenase, partial [Pseudomonadota bacterium]
MTQFTADRLLLFGATGDLARRKLLPSLCALDADGLLADDLKIIGTARSDLDDAAYQDMARAALDEFLDESRRGDVERFIARLSYQSLDATTLEGFAELAAKVGTPRHGLAIFLSTAPSLFGPTIAGLEHAGLTGEAVRIGLEKPLGTDLETSCA